MTELTSCPFRHRPSWSSLGQRRRGRACRRIWGAWLRRAGSPRRARGHRICGSESLLDVVSNAIETKDMDYLMVFSNRMAH
jgi:hypothetical protein